MAILVTGGTGKLGSRVAKLLLDAGAEIRLLVRDRSRLTGFDSIEVVEGDYSKPESLKSAFEDVSRAFIVSLHGPPVERAALHKNAFDAAAKANVRFVVYTSYQGVSEDSTFTLGRDHYLSEQSLQDTGLTYAALRNNFYMDYAHNEVRSDGVLASPSGDGPVAWVSRNDIAELVAHLLLNPLSSSEAFDVTGPEALKFSELAQLLSRLSGKQITYQEETIEEGLAWRRKFDLPSWDLEAWFSGMVALGKGEIAAVSNTIERFLGRRPCSLAEFYELHPEKIEALKQHIE